jgi:hypothetical protein
MSAEVEPYLAYGWFCEDCDDEEIGFEYRSEASEMADQHNRENHKDPS